MTEYDQNIAIAKFCGYSVKQIGSTSHPWVLVDPGGMEYSNRWETETGAWSHGIPQFTSDLNAIHEAEDNLNDVQQVQFCIELRRACFGKPNQLQLFYAYHSDAHMRSEALLKTIETVASINTMYVEHVDKR